MRRLIEVPDTSMFSDQVSGFCMKEDVELVKQEPEEKFAGG